MPAQQMEVRGHASLLVVVHLATHGKGDWGSFSGLLQAMDIALTVKGGRIAVIFSGLARLFMLHTGHCSPQHMTTYSGGVALSTLFLTTSICSVACKILCTLLTDYSIVIH